MHVSSFSVTCTKYVSGSYLVDSQADWHSSTSRLYRLIAFSMSSYVHLNISIIGAVSISWIGCTACLRLGFLLSLFWSLFLWYGCLCSLYGLATLFNLFLLASTNLSIQVVKAASSRFSGFTRICVILEGGCALAFEIQTGSRLVFSRKGFVSTVSKIRTGSLLVLLKMRKHFRFFDVPRSFHSIGYCLHLIVFCLC